MCIRDRIIDGEKGNTVEMAKAGNIKLENIWFAGMTVVGSDAVSYTHLDVYKRQAKCMSVIGLH